MTSPRWWLPCLLACTATLAVGCGGRIPPTHYYVLELHGEGHEVNPGPAVGGLKIGVESFAVDPPYDQDRLIYRVGEGSVEIGFYHYHRWATPLSRMLPRVVAAGLRGTPGVSAIEPAASARDYAATLEGRLLSLEEVDTPEGQRVLVRMHLTLRLADGTEIWTESLAGEGTAESGEVAALVEELCGVLGQVLGQARVGLEQALRQHAASGPIS